MCVIGQRHPVQVRVHVFMCVRDPVVSVGLGFPCKNATRLVRRRYVHWHSHWHGKRSVVVLLCCGCFGRTWCTLGSQPPLEKRPSKTSWFCSQMMYMCSISQQRGAGYLSVQAVIIRSLKSFDQSPTSIHLMKTLGCHTSDNSSLLYNSEKWLVAKLESFQAELGKRDL